MAYNPGKCHYMLIGNHDESNKINLNGTEITSSSNKKLHGVLIDKKLNFDVHIKSLCKKEDQKLSALARVSNDYTLHQKLLLINLIIKS